MLDSYDNNTLLVKYFVHPKIGVSVISKFINNLKRKQYIARLEDCMKQKKLPIVYPMKTS